MEKNLIITKIEISFFPKASFFCFSYPYTSPQNGKAERSLHSINDILRTLLIQASLPPCFWVEALWTTTYLLNIRPTKICPLYSPFQSLFLSHPDYSDLRVFGCLCFPNTSSTAAHKLAPRSLPCIYLGPSDDHKGSRCFDPSSGRVLISRHVTFDEHTSPFPLFSPCRFLTLFHHLLPLYRVIFLCQPTLLLSKPSPLPWQHHRLLRAHGSLP
jgi:hypothetical protein